MGGRGARGRALPQPLAEPFRQLLDEDRHASRGTPPTEQDATPDQPQPEQLSVAESAEAPAATEVDAAAWERLQAVGMANASRDDLVAALDAAPSVGKRWDIESELRRRAEDQARQGVHAAREADRAMSADRAAQVQNAITAHIAQRGNGDFTRLSDLRASLPPDLSRAEVDAVLRRLSRSGDITLAPHPDQKSHRLSDHENGIWLGNENNHLISWNPRE